MLKRLFVELRFLYPTDSRFNSSSPVFRLLALYSNICAILHAAACWPQALITDLQHGATNKAVQAVQIARPRCRGVKMASRPGPPRRIASKKGFVDPSPAYAHARSKSWPQRKKCLGQNHCSCRGFSKGTSVGIKGFSIGFSAYSRSPEK